MMDKRQDLRNALYVASIVIGGMSLGHIIGLYDMGLASQVVLFVINVALVALASAMRPRPGGGN